MVVRKQKITNNTCFVVEQKEIELNSQTHSIVLHSPKEANSPPMILSPILQPHSPILTKPKIQETHSPSYHSQLLSPPKSGKPLSPRLMKRLSPRQTNNLRNRKLSIIIPTSESPRLTVHSPSQSKSDTQPFVTVTQDIVRVASISSYASSSDNESLNYDQFLLRLVRYDVKIRSICPDFKNYWDKNYVTLFTNIQVTYHTIDASDITALAKKAIGLKNSVRSCAVIEFEHYHYDKDAKLFVVEVTLTFGSIQYENHTRLQKWDNTSLLVQEIKINLPRELAPKLLTADPSISAHDVSVGTKTTCHVEFPIHARIVKIAIDSIWNIWQSYQFPLAFYLSVDKVNDNVVMWVLFELRPYVPSHNFSPMNNKGDVPKLSLNLDEVSSSPLYRDPVQIKGKCSRSLLQSPSPIPGSPRSNTPSQNTKSTNPFANYPSTRKALSNSQILKNMNPEIMMQRAHT